MTEHKSNEPTGPDAYLADLALSADWTGTYLSGSDRLGERDTAGLRVKLIASFDKVIPDVETRVQIVGCVLTTLTSGDGSESRVEPLDFGMGAEMNKALAEDAAKLEALTGEQHAYAMDGSESAGLRERERCIEDIQDALGDWGGPERQHYTEAMQRAIHAIENRAKGLDLWDRPLTALAPAISRPPTQGSDGEDLADSVRKILLKHFSDRMSMQETTNCAVEIASCLPPSRADLGGDRPDESKDGQR